jgi:membrane associated rhomboid family serine protease
MNRTSVLRRPFRYRYYNATLIIIAINVAVFFLSQLSDAIFYTLAMVPAMVVNGYVWQVFTYMFAHANLSHLFFNMLGLLFFGIHVEKQMGSSEFLLFYLLTGLLAGIFSFVAYASMGAWTIPLVGASGAIYAVLLAFATINPGASIYVFGILPVRAPILVIAYTVIELGSQVLSAQDGVAHLTHLAGFGFAYLYFLVRYGVNPGKRFFPRNR